MTTTAQALPISDLPAPAIPRISRYRVEALLQCGAWEPEPYSGPEARFGLAAHTALEIWLDPKQRGSVRELVEIAVNSTDGFDVERRAELHRLVADYIGSHERPTTYETEVALERTVDGVAVLWARADRVDQDNGRITIIDLKSHWLSPTQPSQPTFQLRYEAWLAIRRFLDATAITVELHGLRGNVTHRWTLGVDSLEEWGEQMAERLAFVLNHERRPTGNETVCRYCKKRWSCAQAAPVTVEIPPNDSAAEELVQDLARFDAAREMRMNALKAYFEERDPAVLAGMRVGYSLTAPSVRLIDKERALAEGIAKESKPSLRFGITRARDVPKVDAD